MIRKQYYTAERKNKHRLITSKHIKKKMAQQANKSSNTTTILARQRIPMIMTRPSQTEQLLYTMQSKGSIINNEKIKTKLE